MQARQAQADARAEMALDEDFYDGLQWSDEDRMVLEERGQLAQVFNKIGPCINWIVGTERRTRVDFKVLPRAEDDVKGAETKTKLLKYLSDVNKSGFHRSRAFADAVTAGIGWLEDGIRNDPTQERLYSRYESWRNIWYDHLGVELDLSDARYIFRSRWGDLDVAQAIFPDRAAKLAAAAEAHNTLYPLNEDELYSYRRMQTADGRTVYGTSSVLDDAFAVNNRRSRVRLVECWYRVPHKGHVMRGEALGPLNGEWYNEADPIHAWAMQQGLATTYEAVKMRVRVMIFAEGVVLLDAWSPYRHNRFPFTPVWGYRRKRDNTPYGVVRNLRDPQEDLNKRRSKALHLLSTRQVIAEKGAVDDWNHLADEVVRPDGIVIKNTGKELEIRTDVHLAEEHVMLMDQDARYIQDVSGVTDENLGRKTNATSGVAIEARQNQGSTVVAELFDNLRHAIQLQGEVELSLIEQFYDEPKIIRLTGERGELEWLRVNQQGEDGQLNDITASQADFIVDTADFAQSTRQAMWTTLMDMMTKLPPQIAMNLLDLAMEMSDLPGKDEMAGRIRKITGQTGPDGENDPEQQQAMQARNAMDAQMADLTIAEKQAAITLLQERAKTEQARQREIMAGIGTSIEKMSLEKAKVAHGADMDRVGMEQQAQAQAQQALQPQPNAGA